MDNTSQQQQKKSCTCCSTKTDEILKISVDVCVACDWQFSFLYASTSAAWSSVSFLVLVFDKSLKGAWLSV